LDDYAHDGLIGDPALRGERQGLADQGGSRPLASVVIAVLNEAQNVVAVNAEVIAALEPLSEAFSAPFEIVYVDDGSTDETPAIIHALAEADPRVRLVCHDRRCGKSAALRTGVLASRAEWIATMDGDGQNDPLDVAEMLKAAWAAQGKGNAPAPIVAGIRVRRNDPASRLIATKIANGLRSRVLGDSCPDTGCGLKVFKRDDFLLVPLFEGMHRFLPALFQRYGHPLICMPVRHRARLLGESKYTNWGRALVGVVDLAGVIWLTRRTHLPSRVRLG
jgi:dolichol-phosphate mannosyltransferase